jgi:hypothetical protein
MNAVNLISLFPDEHVTIKFEADKVYHLPRSLPERMIFTENWQVPGLEFNDPNSLIIRNSSGYITGQNEIDFLEKNRNILEPNIIFDKKGIYNLIDNFTTSDMYQDLLIIYNKITSDNFILKIENNICNLYCGNVFINVLDYSSPILNHYLQLYYSNQNNNIFSVFIDYIPRLRNFKIFNTPTNFNREKLLIFSLYLFYDNIYLSYNENIARITLMDMDLFLRNYYLTIISDLMLQTPQNDFFSSSLNYYQNNIVRFYNISDVIFNR